MRGVVLGVQVPVRSVCVCVWMSVQQEDLTWKIVSRNVQFYQVEAIDSSSEKVAAYFMYKHL